MSRAHLALVALLALVGCPEPPGDDDTTGDDDDGVDDDDVVGDDDDQTAAPGFVFSDPIVCAEPTEGFDRLTDRAAAAGIDFAYAPTGQTQYCPAIPGGVVVQDLDGDAALDLLFWEEDAMPRLYVGDGAGDFTAATIEASTGGIEVNNVAAADLSGDGLPDLVLSGPDGIAVAENQGGFTFADAALIYENDPFPRACYDSFALGDLDGDHDLDLVIPRLAIAESEDWILGPVGVEGAADLVLVNNDGTFVEVAQLQPDERVGLSVIGAFTDHDDDGDLDILLGSEFGAVPGWPPTALYRNDGDPSAWLNIAPSVGADHPTGAMGLAMRDLNGDGAMDYCLSDMALSVACLVSFDGGPTYVESGAALGLSTAHVPEGDCDTCWSQWGFVLEDLDGDGELDAISGGGPPPDGGAIGASTFLSGPHPDAIWQGDGSGGFIDRTAELGFGDPAWHYGIVAADLNRDGSPEVIINPWEGAPQLLSNPCSAGSWVTIDPVGVGLNAESYGVRVEVEVAGRLRVQELHALVGVVQGPSELRFSIGEAEAIDRVTVRWPDGASVEATAVPTNVRVTAYHPDALR